VAVSPNPEVQENNNIVPFTADIAVKEDRVRLIAFLKQEKFQINRIIHNQPFMIAPMSFQQQIKEGQSPREEMKANERVNDLKEKIRVLVETPLFINGEMIDEDVIAQDSRILQII